MVGQAVNDVVRRQKPPRGVALLLFAAISVPVDAQDNKPATYYVSASGDDAAAGTSAEQPWHTVERESQAQLKPDDAVLFKAGSDLKASCASTVPAWPTSPFGSEPLDQAKSC